MAEGPSVRSETYTPGRLIAGSYPIVTEVCTVAAGADAVRGSVMGRITASGKWVLSLSAASDGSQTPKGILVDNAAAASADVAGAVYRSGEFAEAALTIGTGHTVASVREALAQTSVFVRSTVAA